MIWTAENIWLGQEDLAFSNLDFNEGHLILGMHLKMLVDSTVPFLSLFTEML